ncbi:paraspeckle component 1-like isoform X2 [Liolophura sinensis]|uniref:paraspeckle component 1-like isoform X2 n=1 Tax=Liolophura sinensis TaxID=3198878 RepID=UPI003158194D
MGRNDFDRRTEGRSPMKGGMMNPNRGGYINRGGFNNRGGGQNRGGQQNRGGPPRGGMPHRGGPGGRGSHQNNRGGQQRPRGGSQSGNTITVTPNKNLTQIKQEKPATPLPVKDEKKTPVKTDNPVTPTNVKSEKTTPLSQKTTPQAQNFKSPQPRQQQSQPQRSTPSPNSSNMRPPNQKPQTPTQASPRGQNQSTQQQNTKDQQKAQQVQNQGKSEEQNQGQSVQNQGRPQQNQGRPQQSPGRSQLQQQQTENRQQGQESRYQNQRDFRNNRSASQNRRERNENRFQERGSRADDSMEGQTKPREEKKFTMRCRLFVGNLTAETSEEEFKSMFEPFGELSEVYLNPQRGFGFCRLDYRSNAEAAKAALDGTVRKGRTLRVRFASHGAALRVKNLSPVVSNELLESAFSQLGEVERAVVVCDDRGKSTGEGLVEFARKQVALSAMKRINDGVFMLTAAPRPIFVEPLEQKDEEDGLAEKFLPKNDQYRKEREVEPRFAQPGSFEFSFASKWKQIVEMEKSQLEQVKRNVEEAKLKLEGEMETAQMEHQEELLRKDLMRQQEELRRLQEIRQQSELRRRQEMEMRMRQQEDDERLRQDRRPDMMMRRNDNMRRPLGGDAMGQDDIMMGQGGIHDLPGGSNRGNAPPLPPPPAPPASMGLDRGRSQMSGGLGNNYGNQGMGGPVGMGGDSGMGGPGGQMPQFDGPSGNNFGSAGAAFPGQGNMGGMGGGMGGVSGPGNMYNQGGMGGNLGQPGMRGNERGMDRRREGGPREDYGEMKRMRRF